MNRRRLCAWSLCSLPMWSGLPSTARASGFPSRPARLIVPFTPGGSNDVLARLLSDKLGTAWGQAIVVDNRPGAAGNFGADMVAKSPPDGYTMLIAANSILTTNAAMFSRMPFDPVKDLQPVSLLGIVPFVLVAGPSAKVNSIAELIALGKSRPGGITYASSGVGSPQHLLAELFRSVTGIPMTHVPYKGAAPAINDLLAGRIDIQFGSINQLLPHVRAGSLTALGAVGYKRLSTMPKVPTLGEAGLSGFESNVWVGLCVPAQTPPDVVERINKDVQFVLAMSEVKDKLAEQGMEPQGSSPAEMAKLVATETARWSKVIKAANIKAD